jgi:hypothetical protein
MGKDLVHHNYVILFSKCLLSILATFITGASWEYVAEKYRFFPLFHMGNDTTPFLEKTRSLS